MGVADFLPRILASAGRQIDLQRYGQVECSDTLNGSDENHGVVNKFDARLPGNKISNNSKKRGRPWDTVDVDNCSTTHHNNDATTNNIHQNGTQRQKRRRRPLRIGVDVSVWVSKAAHGFGDMLLDERHLSNFGRASLLEQQQKQQQQKQQHHHTRDCDDAPEEKDDDDVVVNGVHWNIQGTAQPRPPLSESPIAKRRREARLEEIRNGVITPNPQMIQNYVMTCAQYVMKRLETLRELTKADVLVVLDGKTPPIKAKEVKRRSDRRNEAEQIRDKGPTLDLDQVDAATEPRVKASRTAGAGRYYGDIISELLKAMRSNQVPFLVAPYEADAQLAFLSNQGYIDLIITEDSDLLAHGPRSVLFKAIDPIGQQRATGILVHSRDLGAGTGKLCLQDFSPLMLAVMFVAAGCDYCEKLKGIGIVAACNVVRGVFLSTPRNQSPMFELIFQRLYQNCYEKHISTEFKRQYESNFLAALAMYRHPIVFDPVQRKCIFVNNPFKGGIDKEMEEYPPYEALVTNQERLSQVVGELLDSRIATHVAEGWINPKTNRIYSGTDVPSYVMHDMDPTLEGCDDVDEFYQEADTQEPVLNPAVPTSLQSEDISAQEPIEAEHNHFRERDGQPSLGEEEVETMLGEKNKSGTTTTNRVNDLIDAQEKTASGAVSKGNAQTGQEGGSEKDCEKRHPGKGSTPSSPVHTKDNDKDGDVEMEQNILVSQIEIVTKIRADSENNHVNYFDERNLETQQPEQRGNINVGDIIGKNQREEGLVEVIHHIDVDADDEENYETAEEEEEDEDVDDARLHPETQMDPANASNDKDRDESSSSIGFTQSTK